MHDIRFHNVRTTGVDAMTASTERSFPRHTHDQYGIGVVDAGGHASWSGRGHVEAGPGAFICVNPGEVHDGRAIGHRPRSWRILYVEPAAMSELREDVLEGEQTSFTFAKPVFLAPALHDAFEETFAHVTASRDSAMARETALINLVANLGVHSTRSSVRSSGPTASIRRTRDRIDADPTAPLKLADLAKEAGVSRFQLLRAFARDLGLTPHAYILQQRIALARRLIRAGHSLAQVAAVAGFCDQSHLHRCFVRQFGVTPRRYAAGR